ncbi:tRNA (guanosine(46)-N7)-methyltransferase TrmB [Alkalibacter rhizosphaerae]|uniref:tRNA (guanine-N(7)-)-methyltransferase n=1 Tax=Alkalibacter rhizosphaerae TaxID=2815577 RepID=A0A974XI93_9FIRM|nr:tRNA (guanosine(46)-N7)-methyltransferase TrmB [Alkalibacter rhizosphaerae]QSX08853.1 tRNA (guanosine(46)-N7)-methyltransferase TrmB [Alkalibacter rhizosphaerae]
MRLRKKPWAEPEMRQDPKVLFEPVEKRGHWQAEFGNDRPIHLELGCGKGQFIIEMAKQYPDINFIALDYQHEVLVYLLRDANEAGLKNIRILPSMADLLLEYFDANEIEKIYIQFCNPWPKVRHQKRRLTHPRFLKIYDGFLQEGGSIHFKTDHADLFDDSLDYFDQSGFDALKISRDLHHDDLPPMPKTEYETKFTAMGMPIHFGLFQKQRIDP